MMIKTKEAGTCPYCNSENINYGDTTLDAESLAYNCICNDCKQDFQEWYVLEYCETIGQETMNSNIQVVTNNKGCMKSETDYSICIGTGCESEICTTGLKSIAISTGSQSETKTYAIRSIAVSTGYDSIASSEANHSVAITTDECSEAIVKGKRSIALTTERCSDAVCDNAKSIAICRGSRSI